VDEKICPILNSNRQRLDVEPMVKCPGDKCEWWEKAINCCVVRALYQTETKVSDSSGLDKSSGLGKIDMGGE